MKRGRLGKLGERLGQSLLQERGYQIRETNYRCQEGEIDIVAEKGDFLVFVEVRTRSGEAFGSPEESVTPLKQERLKRVALHYIASHSHLPPHWRVDVVAIGLDRQGRVARRDIIENAIA